MSTVGPQVAAHRELGLVVAAYRRVEELEVARAVDAVGPRRERGPNRHVWDGTWDQERSGVRKGNGPRTTATLRQLAISLIKLRGFEMSRWLPEGAK